MPKFTPRRVKNAEERNAGRGQFITLKKTNDFFLGYALFVANPELDDNAGYYEYFEHYTPATGYCPCAAGEDQECPLCAEGDNPNSRAKSVWLVVDSEDDDPESGKISIFNLNYTMVQEFAEDGADSLGRLYRVKRLEGKGAYSIRPKTGKLTKTQLKVAMKGVEEDMLEKMATRQMNRVFEEMDVADAMENDDDDDKDEKDEETPKETKSSTKSKKGKPEDNGAADAFDPEEASEFEGTVTVVKVDKKQNVLTVKTEDDVEFQLFGTEDDDLTEFTKGDELTVAATKDEDDDFVVDSVEAAEAEPEPEPADELSEVTDATVTITKVNSAEDTLIVETEDGIEFELYFPGNGEDDNDKDWTDLDIDDYSEGQQVVISAAKDDDGDMLASVFPEPVKASKSKSKTKAK